MTIRSLKALWMQHGADHYIFSASRSGPLATESHRASYAILPGHAGLNACIQDMYLMVC